MHISVHLQPAIINQCLNLHYRYHPLGRRQLKKLVWIPLILIAIASYLIYPEVKQGRYGQNMYMGLLYFTFAIGYYVYMKKRMLKAGKTVASSLGNNAHFQMEITPEQLVTATQDSTLTTTWGEFTEGLIGKNVVLLYQQNGTFSMYHESFFNTGDFDLFKVLVEEKVNHLITAV